MKKKDAAAKARELKAIKLERELVRSILHTKLTDRDSRVEAVKETKK